MGDIVTDCDDEYGQPNISYHLSVIGTAKATNDSRIMSLENKREILLRCPSEVQPPLETHDFPTEFVESQSHPWRFSLFDRSSYKMTLLMAEPSPVVLQDATLGGGTTTIIQIRIERLDRSSITGDVLQQLHKIQFKVLLALRSKTFYSTRPFPGFPCQAMLTVDGPVRLHDQVMSLGQQNQSINAWDMAQMLSPTADTNHESLSWGRKDSSSSGKSHLSSESSSSSKSYLLADGSGALTGTCQAALNLPVTVPGDILPTFCSAVASRQYSLIARIRVDGIRIQNFVLEVPLQITFSPCEQSVAVPPALQDLPSSEDYGGNFSWRASRAMCDILEEFEVVTDHCQFLEFSNDAFRTEVRSLRVIYST